jgi:hypothetical protein
MHLQCGSDNTFPRLCGGAVPARRLGGVFCGSRLPMKHYSLGKVVRAADGAGLENQCAVTPYQEFESLTFRECAELAQVRGRLRQSKDCFGRSFSLAQPSFVAELAVGAAGCSRADPDARMVGHLATSVRGTARALTTRRSRPTSTSSSTRSSTSPATMGGLSPHQRRQGRPPQAAVSRPPIFFPTAGRTPGQNPLPVVAQPGYKENVRFAAGGLTFSTVHGIGSDNDLVPWTGGHVCGNGFYQVSERLSEHRPSHRKRKQGRW